MENQPKNKSKGLLVTLCILVVVLILVVLYAINKPSQDQNTAVVSTSTPIIVAPVTQTSPTAVKAVENTQASDPVFTRRQECSQKLDNFKQQTQAEYNRELGSNNNFFLDNFVVGYSPSLQTCIGGYNAASEPGGNYVGVSSQYSIINLDTNQAITGLPGEAGSTFLEDSNPSYPNHEYKAYLTQLSILTDGQLH